MKIVNKYFILLIQFLIFVFICCEKNVLGPQEQNSYFPMKVGNSWTYVSVYDTFTVSIVGKKNINNHEYYVFTSEKAPYYIADTSYYRENEEGNIMCYSTKSNDEFEHYYFSKIDTSWQSGQYSYYMRIAEEEITIPFGNLKGEYTDLCEYRCWDRDWPPVNWGGYFAKGIGIILWESHDCYGSDRNYLIAASVKY